MDRSCRCLDLVCIGDKRLTRLAAVGGGISPAIPACLLGCKFDSVAWQSPRWMVAGGCWLVLVLSVFRHFRGASSSYPLRLYIMGCE